MFYSMEDIEAGGIKDLKEIGETASLFETYFSGIRIRATDDGDYIYYQRVGEQLGEIHLTEVEYIMPTDYMLDETGLTKEEFIEIYGEVAVGFSVPIDSKDEDDYRIYLVNDFIRDDI